MSRENVDLVTGLYPPPDADYVQLFRDESLWSEWAEGLTPVVHADFECVMHEFGSAKRYAGVDGLRAFMLDWTAPWATYRIEIEDAVDLGEQVLLLNHDRGRREGSTQEVRGRLGAVFTVRDGKVARLDTYTTRADALEAVGLTEQEMSQENFDMPQDEC